MESVAALLSSLPVKQDHYHCHHSKPRKIISNLQKTATILRITSANFRARLNSNNNSAQKTAPLLRMSHTHFTNPLQNHQVILKIASFLNLSLNFVPVACLAAETAAVSNELVPDKINLESVLISIDDFFNRNPFFVSGVTFIWLVVIPLAQEYLKKYKFIAAIDAFRKLRDDANTQLLDIRDNRSLMYLGSPNLRILNKKAVQFHFVEGEEDAFVKKVLERFKDPGNTTVCIIDKSVPVISSSLRRPISKEFLPSTSRMTMEKNGGRHKISDNPKVNEVQHFVNNDPADGWDKCWEQGITPWDLGGPTPVLLHLLQTGALPKGRVLVPGCGTGYDVVAMASPERYVIGLDISENAIKKGIQLFSSSLSKEDYFVLLKEDFFTWHPTELFDLIFDYTFFCAIEPNLRSAWASRVKDLLKPDGELITLMFPISNHVGGPPYKVSLADYEEVLHPVGFEAIFVADNELAVGQRKGQEKLGRWKRSQRNSHL